MDSTQTVGGRRCWPCAIANSGIGLAIAWIPPAVILVAGNRSAVSAATTWGVVITVYTAYRLVGHGGLPLAERVAKGTGLHDRIGPGSHSGEKEKRDRPETGR